MKTDSMKSIVRIRVTRIGRIMYVSSAKIAFTRYITDISMAQDQNALFTYFLLTSLFINYNTYYNY